MPISLGSVFFITRFLILPLLSMIYLSEFSIGLLSLSQTTSGCGNPVTIASNFACFPTMSSMSFSLFSRNGFAVLKEISRQHLCNSKIESTPISEILHGLFRKCLTFFVQLEIDPYHFLLIPK